MGCLPRTSYPVGRLLRLMFWLGLCAVAPFGVSTSAQAANIQCDVAIVGGGPSGVHTAYKLTTMHLSAGPVCLFEMKDHLGGRVGNNVTVGQTAQPFVNNGNVVVNSGQTGVGGYRMYFNQYTYKLGLELAALGQPGQLTFLPSISFSKLTGIANAGFNRKYTAPYYFTYDTKYDAPLYLSPINDNDLWKTLVCGPQVPVDANNFPQYRKMTIPNIGSMSTFDYLYWVANNVVSAKYGPSVAQYMLDVYRFRADFRVPSDAISYLEYSAKDYTGGTIYYPIPSFQPYFDIMRDQILANQGRIYLNEQVLRVDSSPTSSGYPYTLQTANNVVTARTVIFALPDTALLSLAGDVVARISAQSQAHYLVYAKALTVTHQFGDGVTPNSGWWNPANNSQLLYPYVLGSQLTTSSNPLRRSTNNFMLAGDKLPNCHDPSCDFSGTYFYNNTNELPLTPYHDWINVSRSVYNDDNDAVDNWVNLYRAGETLQPGGGGAAAVNSQVLKSLRLIYPRVFTGNPAQEPQILATAVNWHDPAWYYLKQGSFASGMTYDKLFAWSQNPLPGERVYLLGDAWRPDLSGWSDAAYKTSIYLLNRVYGTHIDPKEESTTKCVNGNIVDPN